MTGQPVSAPTDETARELVVEWCRELRDDLSRCPNVAEFLIWGKLFPPEALGPRCYDCAAKHVGHRNLGDKAVAIFDLRGLARREARDDG